MSDCSSKGRSQKSLGSKARIVYQHVQALVRRQAVGNASRSSVSDRYGFITSA